MSKKRFWETEAFSKRQAEMFYKQGPKALFGLFGALLTISIAYVALHMQTAFEVVDFADTVKLKQVLTSGEPWLVLCNQGETIPKGFEQNLDHLGVTRAAILNCGKLLPNSGQSVISKYKLNAKLKPLGFLSVGGKRMQLDHKLLQSDDQLALGKFVRKEVARRFSLTEAKQAAKVRTMCGKIKCALWSENAHYFGTKRAVNHPRWTHVRVSSNIRIGGKALEGVALVWPRGDERYGVYVKQTDQFHEDVVDMLQLIDEDESFAITKGIKLGWEWATTEEQQTSSKPTQNIQTKDKSQTTSSPTKLAQEPMDQEEEDLAEEKEDDSGIDLDMEL